ncbi:chromosome segregation protein SMC [Myxosarcina sp. GI1]|uniref:chromosome segregation protein SMC n=1 Tax=Myxosarcina sp. GI1 TaxID=1541065 RepID=UPI00055BCB64|nr:chromosome segregation protein SMC [Myxosarcina sp. GI1]
MVHIKRVELSHFKSFGGTTKIPILPGFTVVSGPNGSGKSNILDALLFCLGLASSKGMRADRLPDLINHKYSSNGNSKGTETVVSVTFDLSDLGDLSDTVAAASEVTLVSSEELKAVENNGNGNGHHYEAESELKTETSEVRETKDSNKVVAISNNGVWEWKVTRRLRVGKNGNYSSTFYINDAVATATEVHEQLEKLRIYPEGYNVVLQGDVTRIITMNSRERREIIDELAGVAAFDRKIQQTRNTLDKVREKAEKCQIIAQELVANRDRLAADRVKAEKYRKLKEKIQEKQQQEIVLVWRSLQQQQQELQAAFSKGENTTVRLTTELEKLNTDIKEKTVQLEELNAKVKALGEDEQLSVASELATHKAKRHQLQQQQSELTNTSQQKQLSLVQTQQCLEEHRREISQLANEKNKLSDRLPELTQQVDEAKETVAKTKENADAIAAASEAWVQEQASLTREVTAIQNTLNPQRTEQARISEKLSQLETSISQQSASLETTESELASKQADFTALSSQVKEATAEIAELAQQLSDAESDRSVLEETQQRLLNEQRDKQRALDKLEATKQAQQEIQGTYASKIILNSNLSGVHGLVVQLGQVEPRYQLALETAAGGRLGFIVVESDRVAAEGIELLKRQRAGRATFLPLNKINSPNTGNTATMRFGRGFIDLAVNLVSCDSRYDKIFAYVFGNTVVYDSLDNARSQLGKYRIVTLEGDLLEASGAMTGGSKSARSTLHFGNATTKESDAAETIKDRLTELSRIISGNSQTIADLTVRVKNLGENLTEVRQVIREKQLRQQQLETEIKRLTGQRELYINQLHLNRQERDNLQTRLQNLAATIPNLETQLQQYQQQLAKLEESHSQSEWQQVRALIKSQEDNLHQQEIELRQTESHLQDLTNNQQRLTDKVATAEQYITDIQTERETIDEQQTNIAEELKEIEQKIAATEAELQQLSEKLGTTKQERDRSEQSLREWRETYQKQAWQLEKLRETQKERQTSIQTLQHQIAERERELPNPIPEIPQLVNDIESEPGEAIAFNNLTEQLEQLQKQIRNGHKRLEAMEPVNMLALEEYEQTEARLQELSDKLDTIEAERTELLLRVEKFTTLRLRAFKEAFDAVNENFKIIYAELSDGDGHLQLEDENDPFNGGLNLVAHPKGKPVQRLSSMSGGEKSLTALGFIFSLQKYRPSPFYAFDEVDMFLDGANVEKLSRMVKKQAQEAQFIVVSLRRPMIEASERTIGVTQARGAHTQVLGIKMK